MILMQASFDDTPTVDIRNQLDVIPDKEGSRTLDKVQFLIGSKELAMRIQKNPTLVPFDERVVQFLNEVSNVLMKDPRSRDHADVVTFAFWIRTASIHRLKKQFSNGIGDGNGSNIIKLGRGVAFHIAPSNVPVNFAYSLVTGLLTGNSNIVRVSNKDFPQVGIITDGLNKVLDEHKILAPYILCVRYERLKEMNDWFSACCDTRIIWGGDKTIAELRKSTLPPRSNEITFADRYSIAVIDADYYLSMCEGEQNEQERVAQDFYNDTFFSDQNACTSPGVVVWIGSFVSIAEAKKLFWKAEYHLVSQKYIFQDIMGVNKLTQGYLAAADKRIGDTRIEEHNDNLIVRVKVHTLTDVLMTYRENSGYFYEYDCQDIMEIRQFVNNKCCQTVGYIGEKSKMHKMFIKLLNSGVKGIDRIVPVGHTMDFNLIWDGYNLCSMLTRNICIS